MFTYSNDCRFHCIFLSGFNCYLFYSASNALTGDGVSDGIAWLAETVTKYLDSGGK